MNKPIVKVYARGDEAFGWFPGHKSLTHIVFDCPVTTGEYVQLIEYRSLEPFLVVTEVDSTEQHLLCLKYFSQQQWVTMERILYKRSLDVAKAYIWDVVNAMRYSYLGDDIYLDQVRVLLIDMNGMSSLGFRLNDIYSNPDLFKLDQNKLKGLVEALVDESYNNFQYT